MLSNASRIRTYRLPPGNAARATRAVSSGIGSGFRACSDILASNPSDFPGSAGYAHSRPQTLCRHPTTVTEFATSITFGEDDDGATDCLGRYTGITMVETGVVGGSIAWTLAPRCTSWWVYQA